MIRLGVAMLVASTLVLAVEGRPAGRTQNASQVPVFSSGVKTVRIDAHVTQNGVAVHGLSASDFEVRDNGVLQEVEIAIVEQIALRLVLAFDASDSVAGAGLVHLQSAANALLDGLKPDDRAGLLTFNHTIAMRQAVSKDLVSLRRELMFLKPTGLTSLVDAAFSALTLTQPGGAHLNLVLVFSDGDDTVSWLTTDRVLDVARRTEATVYSVSLKGTGRDGFLKRLSETTGGTLLEVESTNDLASAFLKLLAEFRDRYVLSYSPRGVSNEGWHSLQVRVKNRRASVVTRAGYFAK